MAEQVKRGLRPKRPPRYRASDVRSHLIQEQDPDNPSYTRPNYAKLSAASHSHEYVSPSVILNQNAKALVKFINKSNKYLRDMRVLKEQSQKQASKKESIPKEKIVAEVSEPVKKQISSSRNLKTEGVKKNKQLYNFKGLHQNSELLKNITQQQVLKGVKGIQSLNGLINNKGIYSGPLSSQLSQLQNLYPYLKDLKYQNLTQSHNPNLFQFNQQQSPQPASKISNQPSSSNQAQTSQSQPQKASTNPPNESQKAQSSKTLKVSQPKKQEKEKEKEKPTHEKIFKRSSYHVAIAYHIYLKGLQEQGIVSGNLIDPTYKARLIKQQAGMAIDQQ